MVVVLIVYMRVTVQAQKTNTCVHKCHLKRQSVRSTSVAVTIVFINNNQHSQHVCDKTPTTNQVCFVPVVKDYRDVVETATNSLRFSRRSRIQFKVTG